MEKRDELEKEERTIFIVLAIIVLIAIGVLLTWYFTKDKKAEDKDSDTKTKTIETKKKEEEETEEDENVSYTVTTKEESNTPVVVLSSNVKANNEEVKIVDTAEVVETPATPIVPVEPIEEITSYNGSILWYLVGEKISFKNFMYGDTIITDGVILKDLVKDDQESVVDSSKYIITDGNIISFLEAGTYTITIQSGEKSYAIEVIVKSNAEVVTLIDELITKIDTAKDLVTGEYSECYNNELYVEFIDKATALAKDLNGSLTNVNGVAQAYQELETLYSEYKASFIDGLINKELSNVNNEDLKEYFNVTKEGSNININVKSEKKNETIESINDKLLEVAKQIVIDLKANEKIIQSISSGDNNSLEISSSLNETQLKDFAKKILSSGNEIFTLGDLIDVEGIDIKITMTDSQTVTYLFKNADNSSNLVDVANISNDDIVLVDTATAQAVVETDVKNEETDEKVINNDIISEEEPSEEVTEPSTFVKEEEDGTGLVKEDQIQEPQALDPNLEVKETTLN